MFNLFKSFRFKLTQQIISLGGKNYIFIESQGNVSFTTVLEARDKKQIKVYRHVRMGGTQENGRNGQSPDLGYHLQLKTKEGFWLWFGT